MSEKATFGPAGENGLLAARGPGLCPVPTRENNTTAWRRHKAPLPRSFNLAPGRCWIYSHPFLLNHR